MKIKSINLSDLAISIILLLFIGCDAATESTSLTLTSLANYQSNDCSGTGSEEACTDVTGNVSDTLTTQISCVAEGLSWINYYQEWINNIDDTNSFNTIMDPNNNTCTITYDAMELSGVWTGDSNSCQIPNSTITSGNCVEFIFTD